MKKAITMPLLRHCYAIMILSLLVFPLVSQAEESGPVIRNTDLGPIVGVTYLNAGALMTGPDRSEMRFAREKGFYYIIGPGGVADYYFLRYSREINPR